MVRESFTANIKEKLLQKWNSLEPENKRKVVVAIFLILLAIVGYLGYVASRGGVDTQRVQNDTQSNVTTIGLQDDLLQRTQYVETLKMYESLKQEIDELKKQNQVLEEQRKREEELNLKNYVKNREFSPPSLPPPPPPPPPTPSFGNQTPMVVSPPPPSVEIVGSIGIAKNQQLQGQDAQRGEQKAETTTEQRQDLIKKKYYLPPSFMEATLLSGLDAPAVGKGEAHPVPCLFRIKAPAVLPNEVKANLKGCFIVAEGIGNLATERADIRTVTLACIDKKGRAVIDEKIKGFIVDSDGKIGLRGRVVSKMGSVLARTLLAGLISGIGSNIGAQTQQVVISPSGALQTIEPGKALQAGIGAGIQQTANELVKFYLDLAKQTIPVVEVLPTRNVTIVISEGVWLNLKDYETY